MPFVITNPRPITDPLPSDIEGLIPSEFPDITLDTNEDGDMVELPAIAPVYYFWIADSYGMAYRNMKDALAQMQLALENVVALDPEVEIELIETAILMRSFSVFHAFVQNVTTPVRTLHQHIVDRGHYESINEYLSEQGILVSQDWADLASECGTPIDSDFVNSEGS